MRTIPDRQGADKRGGFRRYLVEVFKDGKNVNDAIVSAGHAVYRKK